MMIFDLLGWLDGEGARRYLDLATKLFGEYDLIVGGVDPDTLDVDRLPISSAMAILPRVQVSDPFSIRTRKNAAVPFYKPASLSEARRAAKVRCRYPISLLVNSTNIKFFDEGEILILSQNRFRPYVEVCIGEIFWRLSRVERPLPLMHRFVSLLEHALKEGVEVVLSSCSTSEVLPVLGTQVDAVLLNLGFSRTERRTVLLVNPAEVLKRWISPA
ncbi:MAG: hypothetical protein DRO12_02960 [Thermoprotei archaeon]|nr:MAG: hypothetical protein DRO12_02960 [Thermoprotei archaeon]